jgi:DNA-directed RNA polymerase sigma subunit (sigma70/sigma32)
VPCYLPRILQQRLLARSGRAPGDTELAGATLLDGLPGGPFASPGCETEQVSLNHRLLGEIRQLDLAEQQVVIHRWGLHQCAPLTRAEVADQMSISKEWVRQLEQSALNKLGQSEMMHTVYNDHFSAVGLKNNYSS